MTPRPWLSVALPIAVAALALAASPPPDPAASPGRDAGVEVLDGGGVCPAVDVRAPLVAGGCRSSAQDIDAELEIRTAVGKVPFGSCSIAFDVALSADGRIWLDRIRIGGLTPCNDIQPCASPEVLARQDDPYDTVPASSNYPWRGRIDRRGGGFGGRVRLCFDTCAGRFAGDADFALTRSGDEWAMRFVRAGVGSGGLEVDGEWALEPGAFRLRALR